MKGLLKEACCGACRRTPFLMQLHQWAKSTHSAYYAVTLELVMQFGCPSRFRSSKNVLNKVYFMTGTTIFKHLGVAVRRCFICTLHSSNFYTIPFNYCCHAIPKTASLSSLARLLPVLVNVKPPKSEGSPLIMKSMKIVRIFFGIAQKKRPVALNATPKKTQRFPKFGF